LKLTKNRKLKKQNTSQQYAETNTEKKNYRIT